MAANASARTSAPPSPPSVAPLAELRAKADRLRHLSDLAADADHAGLLASHSMKGTLDELEHLPPRKRPIITATRELHEQVTGPAQNDFKWSENAEKAAELVALIDRLDGGAS